MQKFEEIFGIHEGCGQNGDRVSNYKVSAIFALSELKLFQ